MFRSFLEHNYFVHLLRTAYEEGFMTESLKNSPAGGGETFGRTAELCAPSGMPRVTYRSIISPLVCDDDESLDESLREEAKKPIELRTVIKQAWEAGQNDRYSKSRFVHNCDIEALKTFINEGPDLKEVKKKAMQYAVDVSVRFPHFVECGEVETKWGLYVAGDSSCVIGWYYGKNLTQGDYVEYAKGQIVSIGAINRETNKAEALKLTSSDTTLSTIMGCGSGNNEHYSIWESSMLRRGVDTRPQPETGLRDQTQSTDFFNALNDGIKSAKPITSVGVKVYEDMDAPAQDEVGVKVYEDMAPVQDEAMDAIDDIKATASPEQQKAHDLIHESIVNAMKEKETEEGGVIMSEEPIDIDAAKTAAEALALAALARQTITATFTNNPSVTYNDPSATKTFTSSGPSIPFELNVKGDTVQKIVDGVHDEIQKKQILMQLHDRQVISTKGLCERLGLDFDEEIKNMRKEAAMLQSNNEKRPAPKKKIKKPKALKKVRARTKKKVIKRRE